MPYGLSQPLRKDGRAVGEFVWPSGSGSGAPATSVRPLRCFAFGSAVVREKVRQQIGDWDELCDWFVA
jgi:hypothetical protein